MRSAMAWVLAAVCAAWAGGCGPGDPAGPILEQVLPGTAVPGQAVELLGRGFCGAAFADLAGNCPPEVGAFVELGPGALVIRADVVRYEGERITLSVPPSATAGDVLLVVVVEGVASNALPFRVQ